MEEDKTMVFNVSDLENYMITETLLKVKNNLDEKGYNGINQIVGYLTSGDITYISNYKDSRNIIKKIEREKIVETLVKSYLRDLQ
ncbi:MAG: IreB family regulatory phosphoprotein [bacterium]|nr:IreB family regulatory phosphoprotein [bacterium]